MYVVTVAPIFETYFWSIGLSVFNIIRSLVPMILLFIVNIVLIHKFNSYTIEQHLNATPPHENQDTTAAQNQMKMKEMDISRLVLAINVNYLIGYLPNSLSPILNLNLGNDSIIQNFYLAITSLLLILSKCIYIIIFYKLSPSFKKTFLNIFMNK